MLVARQYAALGLWKRAVSFAEVRSPIVEERISEAFSGEDTSKVDHVQRMCGGVSPKRHLNGSNQYYAHKRIHNVAFEILGQVSALIPQC
jgi:hypothetical protein